MWCHLLLSLSAILLHSPTYSIPSANISVGHLATFSYSTSSANIKVEYKNIPEGFTAAELDELAAVGSIKDNVNFMTLVYLVMCSDGLTVLS